MLAVRTLAGASSPAHKEGPLIKPCGRWIHGTFCRDWETGWIKTNLESKLVLKWGSRTSKVSVQRDMKRLFQNFPKRFAFLLVIIQTTNQQYYSPVTSGKMSLVVKTSSSITAIAPRKFVATIASFFFPCLHILPCRAQQRRVQFSVYSNTYYIYYIQYI